MYDKCMLEAGYRIAAVHSAAPGEPQTYDWYLDKRGIDVEAAHAARDHCQTLMPTPAKLTNDEIRKIYDRWVDEYRCLVGLGYHPDPPPSAETFVASYYANPKKGPWMPIDGIDIDHWSQADYQQAKAACTLEFFNMDFSTPAP